jgi:hypothetical protein
MICCYVSTGLDLTLYVLPFHYIFCRTVVYSALFLTWVGSCEIIMAVGSRIWLCGFVIATFVDFRTVIYKLSLN